MASFIKYNQEKIMSVHHSNYVDMGLVPNYDINNILLEEVKEIKYLGVCFDSLLVFDKHMVCEKINKAY